MMKVTIHYTLRALEDREKMNEIHKYSESCDYD
jgi:hypothetical protein